MSRWKAYLRGVDGVVGLSLFEECWDGMLVAISTYPSELLHHGAHVRLRKQRLPKRQGWCPFQDALPVGHIVIDFE